MKNLYKYILILGVALLWLMPGIYAQITSYSPTEIKGSGIVYITYESTSSQAPAASVLSTTKVSGDDIDFTVSSITHTMTNYDPASQTHIHYYIMPVSFPLLSTTDSKEAVYMIATSLGNMPLTVIRERLTAGVNGGFVTPASQKIASGGTAQTLSHSLKGGIIILATPTYQWQVKQLNGQWSNIQGATAQSYAPGQISTPGVYFYRVHYNNAAYSSEAAIFVEGTVEPQVSAGSITPVSQQVESGTTPGTLTHTGHQGVTSRQWQRRVAFPETMQTLWADIDATGETYSPGLLENTMNINLIYAYRIKLNNSETYSAEATVTITPAPATEVITGNITPAAQEVESGTAGAILSHTGHEGVTTRQWQRKSGSGNWSDIQGATSSTHLPGIFFNNGDSDFVHSFRIVINGDNGKISDVATLTIKPAASTELITGSIAPATQEVEPGAAPATLTHTGHQGVTSRQWQRRVDDGLSFPMWTNITGATAETYSPPATPNVSTGSSITYSYRIVINGDTSKLSDVATVLVKHAALPDVTPGTITPAVQEIQSGGTPQTITHAGHQGVTSRQWQQMVDDPSGVTILRWVNVTGATGETYSPPQMTNTHPTSNKIYSYRVVINGDANTLSDVATVVVIPAGAVAAPGKVTPALQEIVFTGIPGTLTHTDYANVTSRQWQKLINMKLGLWENIEGATEISYSPERVTHNGSQNSNDNLHAYRVVVNGDPAQASEIGGIMLYPSNGNPGIITPETQTIEAGETAQELTSNATGAGESSHGVGGNPLHCVQWQRKIGDGQWTDIAGATGMTYSPGIPENPGSESLEYSFRIYINNDPSRASDPATVTVTPFVDPGSVTPLSQTVESAETPVQLVHTGYGNVTSRQWQHRSSGSSWGNISGATGTTYTPAAETNNSLNNLVYYYRVIANGNENKVSEQATVITKPNPLILIDKGLITPQNQIVEIGETPETLSHTGHGEVVQRQWYTRKGSGYWSKISGATGPTYSPSAFDEPGTYQFRIQLNGINNFETQAATITVEDSIEPGYISPATQAIGTGGIATLLTHEGTAGNRGRQWQSKMGDGQWGDIAGATGKTYEPGRLFMNNVNGAHHYFRVVIGGDESLVSENAVVNVADRPASNPDVGYVYVDLDSSSITIAPGEDAGTLVHAGGNNIHTRQWQRKTNNSDWVDIAGATGETFSPGQLYLDYSEGIPADNTTTYYYRVKTTNTLNDNILNSGESTIKVDGNIGMLIIGEIQPKAQTILYGSQPLSLFITDVSGGNGNYSYQWQKKPRSGGAWQNITGADKNIYFPTGLDYVGVHEYRIMVISEGRSKTAECKITTIAGNTISTNGLNASRSYIAKYAFMTATADSGSTANTIPSVTYYDGFGRPEQVVEVGASPLRFDIVTPIEYDFMGRDDVRSHLPYASDQTGGRFEESALTRKASYYTGLYGAQEASRSFVEKVYEVSALGRLEKQFNTGSKYYNSFTGVGGAEEHPVEFDYAFNTAGEVRKISLRPDGGLSVSGGYPAGELYRNSVTNEDGLTVTTFSDGFGKTILERTTDDGVTVMDTYYVYDNIRQLRWVISPEGSKSLQDINYLPESTLLKEYAYQYIYDSIGNLTEKRLPGAVTVRFVYDQHRRMVASQDGNQAQSSEWTLCRYDNLDRILGQRLTNASLANVQSGYTSLYSASADVISEYLYDDYTAVPAAMPAYDGTIVGGLPTSHDTRTKGLKTYEKVRVLDGGSAFIERAFYYDERGRLIQTVEKNLVGVSRYSTVYDFMGNPLTTHEKHAVTGGGSYEVRTDNTYDHRNRLLSTETNFTRFSNQILISQQTAKVRYAYDELGRLLGKQYGEGTGAFSSLTDYNIQGWMTSQKSAHFRTELTYFQNGVQSYTGNILSAKSVMPTSEDEADTHVQTYNYSYDMFGRLLTGASSAGFSETLIRQGMNPESAYDLNGNIRYMKRLNAEEGANFGYEYTGNRLTSIYDYNNAGAASSYTYDRNGNMTRDERKGLQFKYNLLNLVSEVTAIASGDDKATYSYSADGMKLRVRGSADDGYDYLGSITLVRGENEDISGVEALFAEGMFRTGETTQETMFFEKDHLGSVRAVVNSDGQTLATNNYMPFGTRHTGGMRDDNVRYRFNGMELQTTGELNLLDFGARMYDAELGRWFVQDPLAEKYLSFSPYNYCVNNPLRFTDPTGMDIQDELLNEVKYLEPAASGMDGAVERGKFMEGGIEQPYSANPSSAPSTGSIESTEQTKYVNNKGQVLFNTDDGLTDVIVVPDANVEKLEELLNLNNEKGTLNDPKVNQEEMHTLGMNINDLPKTVLTGIPNNDVGLTTGYLEGYNGINPSFGEVVGRAFMMAVEDKNNIGAQISYGRKLGKRDQKNGYINRLEPHKSINNNEPKIKLKN